VDIFETIKSIQSINKNELNHTLKNVLISILIRFGNNGHIWATNSQIGEWIGEDGEYIKNLLSKLKKRGLLKIEGRKSQRKIYPGPKLVRDHQSRIKNVRDSQSRYRDHQSRTVSTPIKRKEKKIIKEKSGATPDFVKKIELWQSIPANTRRRLNKKQVVKASIEKIKYAIERMQVAIEKGGSSVKAFQDAFKGDHAKFTRKMEADAMAEKKEHDKDIVKVVEAANKKQAEAIPDEQTRRLLVKQFKAAMDGIYDRHAYSAIICLPGYLNYENHNWSGNGTNTATTGQ
jgi:hypothetical protein